jgi:soluble lytic murein transglycosylase-like protein
LKQLPPELPDTPLTRGWLDALNETEERQRVRRYRRRRAAILLAIVVVVVTAVAVGLVDRGGSGTAVRPVTKLPGFVPDPTRRALAPAFEAAAHESRIPATLVMALAWRESEWNENLVSGAGAVGIGQLLPPTSVFVAQQLLHEPQLDPRRPVDNIRLTARYLRELIDTFHGDARLGVGAYLQGSTSVHNQGLTPQTTDYVNQITALRSQFERARRGG